MSRTNGRAWIQAIRSYIYQMVALMAFLAAIALGYTLWQQQSSNRLQAIANDFHLASSFHYSQAMQELRSANHILSHVAHNKGAREKELANLHARAGGKSYATLLHLVRRDIAAGLALQQHFVDQRSHALSSKLKRQLQRYSKNNQQYLASFTGLPAVTHDTLQLLKTLEQLVRLHSANRDELLAISNSQQQYRTAIFYALLILLAVVGIASTARGLRAISKLILEQQQVENKIRHQAHYDNLTKLPNRLLSLDRLSQLMSEAKRAGNDVAVLFLDLDDFKKINDTLGHDIGDMLLMQAAQRLEQAVRKIDTVGRLGGDEFIVMLGKLDDITDINAIARKLVAEMRRPFKVDGRELRVTVSIGISIYPQDGKTPQDLLRHADSAMYYAKNAGRNTYAYFTESMNIEARRRVALEEQILGALNREEFHVVFQPKIDLHNGEIMGAEVLLRWHNPTLGNVTPDEFIPIAEHTGLIVPIGQFVLEQALAFAQSCEEEVGKALHMAVNLSPRQFRDPALLDSINTALQHYGIPGQQLELEITEGVLLSGVSDIAETLEKLSASGVKIAMDDFGTGYSSLNYLRAYPFDVIKIDRSFINDIDTDSEALVLIEATVAMAHSLKLEVVAEGV
ncbi:MAG: EAL domain-containing protein, partial [Gammaproteobacteria bacterium]|nr:EAL domain-containing protein [Gammaproteobacteria bacterium]